MTSRLADVVAALMATNTGMGSPSSSSSPSVPNLDRQVRQHRRRRRRNRKRLHDNDDGGVAVHGNDESNPVRRGGSMVLGAGTSAAAAAGHDATTAWRCLQQAAVLDPRSSSFPMDTIALNKHMAVLATQKEAKQAVSALVFAVEHGIANDFTIAIAANAFVRANRLDWALAALTVCRGRLSLSPGVVAVTTIVKGLCCPTQRRLTEAWALVDQLADSQLGSPAKRKRRKGKGMQNPRRFNDPNDSTWRGPNTRTLNTFLRGCLMAGHVEAAARAWRVATQRWPAEAQPNVSSYEYMTALLCQGLRCDAAERLLCHEWGTQRSTGQAWLALARSRFLLGHDAPCRTALRQARQALQRQQRQQQQQQASEWSQAKQASNAKRNSHGRAQSALLYDRHRAQVLRREAAAMESALQRRDRAVAKGASTGPLAFEALLRRTFFLLPDATQWPESVPQLCHALETALRERFGLNALTTARTEPAPSEASGAEVHAWSTASRMLSSKGTIEWARVFGKQRRKLPCCMELCSGRGEWVVAQAMGDASQRNWIACELRADRVHTLLATAARVGVVDNLAACATDARRLFQHHMPPRCLDLLTVNHPEPPQQARRETRGDSEPRLPSHTDHLLDAPFLHRCALALRPLAVFTIVTDNAWYARCLLRVVAPLTGRGKGALFTVNALLRPDSGAFRLVDKCDGVPLWQGEPNAACGHRHAAVSFFDELKRQEKQVRGLGVHRYIICLQRANNVSKAS